MTDDEPIMPPPDPSDSDSGSAYEGTLTEPSKKDTPEDDEEADNA